MDELLDYKITFLNTISMNSDIDEVFPEESYFEHVSEVLSDAGILDNVEYCPYKNTKKGIRIDGYSWNALERTICGIVVNFDNETEIIETLTNTNIIDIGKRVTRFFQNVGSDSFIQSLEVTDPGRTAASEIEPFLNEALKFRVVIFSNKSLSARVRSVSIEKILDRDTTIEIWDLERLKALEESDSEYEEFTVDVAELGHELRVLPANDSDEGFRTFLGVMPGRLLSAIYNEYGQRLLESNVRTFLDFRAATNKGMRKSLVTEPEHFFAYNNGITVTATAIKTEKAAGQTTVTALENMQIVNGGQTTASIYFSPREKGGIKGADGTFNYSEIDLDKVFVQMKLTVIDDKEKADVMKANIATYANSQNSIQASDLVSNHPFHLTVETRSRKQLMPAGEDGLSTKWFYERVRGQYSTQMRALSSAQRRRFEMEYPKKQVFTKTDLAKYENTWRMKPFVVKRGAQANLKLLGADIIKEFTANESNFDAAFYNDLVAKIILFRMTDSAVLSSAWYQEERGLKAEIVTYSIALLRDMLVAHNKDINLSSIYKNQKISDSLSRTLVSIALEIRNRITDIDFTGGVTNPSEFTKSEKGWEKIRSIDMDISGLEGNDILLANQVKDASKERKDVNKAAKAITGLEYVLSVSPEEWALIAKHHAEIYPQDHKNVAIPQKCEQIHSGGKILSDKQLNIAKVIRNEAYEEGFDYIG